MNDLDLSTKSDRLKALKMIAEAQAKDPECQRNLKNLFDSPADDSLATLIRAAEALSDAIDAKQSAAWKAFTGIDGLLADLRNAITNARD